MKPGELKVLEALFGRASDAMGCRGCTDIESHVVALMTKEEWTELFKEMHIANNDPEPYDGHSFLGCNWFVLDVLFAKLKKEAGYGE
jgi:hypothetical protein